MILDARELIRGNGCMNDTLETEFPTRIAGLEGLANNLWWTWHQDARGLFQRLDPTLWALSGKNAVEVLRRSGRGATGGGGSGPSVSA